MKRIRTCVTLTLAVLGSLAAPLTTFADDRGGWIGVQLTPVPAALASHLELEDAGLMIRNVVRGSPADQAGLQRYDVIVEADGEPVAEDIRAFSNHVRDKRPGDELAVRIYRRGQSVDQSVTLGERPGDWDAMDWKHDHDPDVTLRRDFGIRGKVLRPGPDGWMLDDLGELGDWTIPHDWAHPRLEQRLHEGHVTESRRVDQDGTTLHVRRDEDGTITVKRYQTGEDASKIEAKTYKNMGQLKEADPEAHELLRSAEPKPIWKRWIDRLPRPHVPFTRPVPVPDDFTVPFPDDSRWDEWRERFFQGPMKHLLDEHRSPQGLEDETESETRFDVGANGEITVHVRDGEAELNRTFKTEADFKQRAPELYERFTAMSEKIK